MEDEPSRGHVSDFDMNTLHSVVEANPRMTQNDIAETLYSSQKTISRQMKAIGKVQKLGKWVPHDLSENNLMQRLEICTVSSSRQNREPFLDRIVTGDEKWVLHVNMKRRKQWVDKDKAPDPTPKAGLHPRKIMLCV